MPRKLEHKASDFEKRLKILENQLYGKPANQHISGSVKQSDTLAHRYTDTASSDITYLKQDLTKISILTAIAITVELVLYYFVF